MDADNMKKVVEALQARDNFLITAHVNPEGDSVGSQLALLYVLEKLGKTACIVNYDSIPDNLTFLPGAEKVLSEIPDGMEPETLVLLDCPVKERTGNVADRVNDKTFTINVDHHVSNEYFADVNWVESSMSSVGEMMFHIAKALDVGIDQTLAMYIYTAIITDTGMFNYDSTSEDTHRIAGELVAAGLNPKKMHSEIYEKKTFVEIKLLGKTLSTLKMANEGKVAYMMITRKMHEQEGVDFVSTDEFINYPRSIKGVEIAIFFKEHLESPNKVNISFRSTGGVDVNKLAARFGGGGHPAASGCLFNGTLDEALEQVVAAAGAILSQE